MLALRMDRFVSHYNFLRSSILEVEHALEGANESFKREFAAEIDLAMEGMGSQNILQRVNSANAGNRDSESNQDVSRSLRRLFRQIAVAVHPDKRTANTPLFLQAEEAVRQGDEIRLVLIARSLQIDVSQIYTTEEQVDALQKSVDKLQTRIDNIKSSLAWVWHHACDSDRLQLRAVLANILANI